MSGRWFCGKSICLARIDFFVASVYTGCTLFIALIPMKTKIIAVTNQKGGVGKSTLAFHLAHAAVQAKGGRVLCLDLDSQGNLSQYMTGQMDVIDDTEGGFVVTGVPMGARVIVAGQDLVRNGDTVNATEMTREQAKAAQKVAQP